MTANLFLAFRSILHQPPPNTSTHHVLRQCLQRPAFFHSSPIAFKRPKEDIPELPSRKKIPVPEHTPTPKPLRGKKIGIDFVHLLDPTTGRRGHLRPLKELLDSIDPEEFLVELTERDPPTVKLIDVKASRAATVQGRLKEKPAAQKDVTKEIALTWAVADADEKHKMAQIRGYLEKGFRVEVEIKAKRTQPTPQYQEANAKIEDIVSTFANVSKESKARVVTRRKVTLYLQSKMAKTTKVDVEALKESVPKSVQERKLRAEKQKPKEDQQQRVVEPSPDTYNSLWGV